MLDASAFVRGVLALESPSPSEFRDSWDALMQQHLGVNARKRSTEDYEAAVLISMLIWPTEMVNLGKEYLRPEDFSLPGAGELYKAILAEAFLHEGDGAFDILKLAKRLKTREARELLPHLCLYVETEIEAPRPYRYEYVPLDEDSFASAAAEILTAAELRRPR